MTRLTSKMFTTPLVLSEVSVPSEFGGELDEEFQAEAAHMLYTVCFSHKMVDGIFWWNLTDDGILTTKRKATGENLPSTGLIDGSYREKPAYREIDRLINHEWRTDVSLTTDADGRVHFNGYNGVYDVTIGNLQSVLHLSGTPDESTKTLSTIS